MFFARSKRLLASGSAILKSEKIAAIMIAAVMSAPLSAAIMVPTVHAQEQKLSSFSDPSRLVVVGGALTEIVYALGEEDRLIARDQTSTYPEQATKLPDVGYMRNLSAEGVLSVAPTAMLVIEGSGPVETMDVLKRASVPMIVVPEEYSAAGIVNKIMAVGEALGAQQKAAVLAEKVKADIQAVDAGLANITDKKRVLFILSRQGGSIMASGQGTAADNMIKMAGGINAIEGFNGFKQLTDEALDQAAPDLILLMSTGAEQANDGHADLLSNPALAATPAGRNQAIVTMDSLYLLGFGPRTAEATRDLSEKLYGKTSLK